jgi:hypothetical protein
MTVPQIPIGAFIWCRFPLRERPNEPGPADHLHLVYVEDLTEDNVLTIYTTSVTWDPKTPTPIGVVIVNAEKSRAMGQKPFVLDARRLALLPLTDLWFPELSKPDRGIVAIAPAAFRKEVTQAAYAAASRASHIELLGPKAPNTNRERKPPTPP